MKIKRFKHLTVSTSAFLALALAGQGATTQDLALDSKGGPQVQISTKALKLACELDHEELVILDERTQRMPFSGIEVTLVKAQDRRTGEEFRVVLDQGLMPIEHSELISVEREIRHKLFGTMHPDLHRRLQDAKPETPVEILVKFKVEEQPVDRTQFDLGLVSEGQLRERAKAVQEEVEKRSRDLLSDVASRHAFSISAGQKVMGPFVQMTVPARAAKQLARDTGVVFVGPAGEAQLRDDNPTITQSLPTTRTNSVHPHSKGDDVTIAVLEAGLADINLNCFNITDTETNIGLPDRHMTNSLGIIGNRYDDGDCDGAWTGYAPEASVLIANGNSYVNSYGWAKDRSVDVVTMSWHYGAEETSGTLHSRDEFFDHMATRFPYAMIFTSAGNQAARGSFASGKGFNFFGVSDVLNDGDGIRCNDEVAATSSFLNPVTPHSDREIPEIAAPGSRHDLLGRSFGGTSCATPVMASIAACVIGENPSLRWWPEGLRAILLATANYQLADGQLFNRHQDGRDGTGMTDAYYAMLAGRVRANNVSSYYRGHDYRFINDASFANGYLNESWLARTSTVNSRIRVALTWNSKTDGSSSVLDADLDLRVFGPNGHLVASSSCWDSNVEFVEFTPAQVGSYLIRVRGFDIPDDLATHFGVAWTTIYDCL